MMWPLITFFQCISELKYNLFCNLHDTWNYMFHHLKLLADRPLPTKWTELHKATSVTQQTFLP